MITVLHMATVNQLHSDQCGSSWIDLFDQAVGGCVQNHKIKMGIRHFSCCPDQQPQKPLWGEICVVRRGDAGPSLCYVSPTYKSPYKGSSGASVSDP